MGSQQSCCDDEINNEEIPQIKNSIKYGKIINDYQNIGQNQPPTFQNNKNVFSHASDQSQNLQKISSSFNQSQKNPELKQNIKLVSKIKQINPVRSTLKKEVQFQYSPIVKQIIQTLRPFEKQFNQINQKTLKILKLNNQQDLYKGQLDYFQRPHGFGALIKQNGNVLIGNFIDGQAHGNVFYIFSNGSYYKGKMIENQANDTQGEYHSHQLTYFGNFHHNNFHGQGKQLCEDYFFQGEYENNLKRKGVLQWNSPQNRKQQREIKKLPPKRNLFDTPDFKFYYEGQFDENQKFTGQGRLKDQQGEYFGDFLHGKKHGRGQYLFSHQLKYSGEYKNDKKSGFGRLFNSDKTLAYEGQWKDDIPDGKGCSYDLKGKRHESEFIRGISKIFAPSENKR